MAFGIVGAALLLAAAILYFVRRRSAAKQAESLNWPTTEGQIIESYVYEFRDKERDLNYMPRIKFAYSVAGGEFASERLAWGGRSYGRVRAPAEKVVARYPVGLTVPVYYNPQKPKEAVLEPAETGGLSVITFIWVGLTLIGLVFIAVALFVRD